MHFDRLKYFHVFMHLGRKDVNDVKVGIFVGRFPSDGAESLTVKGLN